LEKKEEYRVVDDQFRTPTYAGDLAAGIVLVIEKKATGIYHLSGADIVTPYQMACQTADHLQLDPSLIKRVTAADFSQPAKRPAKTDLLIDKARKDLGYLPMSFAEGLAKTFPG
jgi:dTDP-4-dehydrorhamnose reductase